MFNRGDAKSKAQIAFEFLVVYSFILLIFVVIFLLITAERASAENAQNYSTLELIAQDVAGYMDQAVYAGSGYNTTIVLPGSIGTLPYNVTVSSTGVVIISSAEGSQIVTAQAYSSARGLIINGTLSSHSSNAISLYVLPDTGLFKVFNLNGVVYVDMLPPSTSAFPSYLFTKVTGKTLAANFNGVNSYAVENGVAVLNNANAFTIAGWVYLTANDELGNYIIYSEGSPANGMTLSFLVGHDQIYLCTYASGASTCESKAIPSVVTTANFSASPWTFVAVSAGGANGGNTIIYYQNTSLQACTGCSQIENNPGASYEGIGINVANYIKVPGQLATPFNGFIANLQLYNTVLSYANIQSLYYGGIGTPPVSTSNLIAWYPLNGNANDYSGYGNHAAPNNITYQSVVQVTGYALLANGTLAPGAAPAIGVGGPLVSFVANTGLVSPESNSSAWLVSNVAHGFLTSNGARGKINFTVSLFNGNSSYTTYGDGYSSLVAWFPLDQGYGNTVYGFLPGDVGTAGIVQLTSMVANGYPTWSIVNRNTTNFQAANFSATAGYVTIPSVSTYGNIATNKTFTILAWINFGGHVSSEGNQGIFGDMATGSSGPGFAFYENGGSNTLALSVGGGSNELVASGEPSTYLYNKWLMVTGEYDGNNGQAVIYLNGSVLRSGNIKANLPLAQGSNNFVIGTASWSLTSEFNGIISNAQLYGTNLNQSQVASLYQEGPTGAPLSGQGLLGWWPLDGNANDSSVTRNNGKITSGSVAFNNLVYTNYTVKGPPRYALRESPVGSNALIATSANLFSGDTATIVAWINPTQKQSSTIYNQVLSYGELGTCEDSISAGVQASGIPELSTGACGDDFTPANGPIVNWNTWNFVAYELSSKNVDIFINGQWLNGSIPTAPTVLPGNLVIGGSALSTSIFNGSITDIQVYSTQLPPTAIMQLYQQGLPPSSRVNVTV